MVGDGGQKFRSGNPFDGKPMKRFGEGDDAAALPAPPQIEDVVKEAEAALEPPKPKTFRELDEDEARKQWRCPCGQTLEDCAGSLFFTPEQMFQIAYRGIEDGAP